MKAGERNDLDPVWCFMNVVGNDIDLIRLQGRNQRVPGHDLVGHVRDADPLEHRVVDRDVDTSRFIRIRKVGVREIWGDSERDPVRDSVSIGRVGAREIWRVRCRDSTPGFRGLCHRRWSKGQETENENREQPSHHVVPLHHVASRLHRPPNARGSPRPPSLPGYVIARALHLDWER